MHAAPGEHGVSNDLEGRLILGHRKCREPLQCSCSRNSCVASKRGRRQARPISEFQRQDLQARLSPIRSTILSSYITDLRNSLAASAMLSPALPNLRLDAGHIAGDAVNDNYIPDLLDPSSPSDALTP
jgi:hypothetical protein